ncbi:hypothetical protein [Stutzerimonas stutzeri]|uniref:hypothetical protein n=1 Tax=Stutzerimonas stutzeri TaxID=316 RepID=UPI001C2EA728|nr:hypothetical protein [Stutzerimonas stutzeri]
MNTATATQRIQTSCVLSFALLISGTTGAVHLAEHDANGFSRQGHASFTDDTSSCTASQGPRVIIFDQGARANAGPCQRTESTAVTVPTVRLAKPLSGDPYLRSGDTTRYSF